MLGYSDCRQESCYITNLCEGKINKSITFFSEWKLSLRDQNLKIKKINMIYDIQANYKIYQRFFRIYFVYYELSPFRAFVVSNALKKSPWKNKIWSIGHSRWELMLFKVNSCQFLSNCFNEFIFQIFKVLSPIVFKKHNTFLIKENKCRLLYDIIYYH